MKSNKLTNPTPAQVKYRNNLWAKALDENKKKARESMRDKNGGRCCLQVAEDVAIACGLDIKRSDRDSSIPCRDVADFFGWNDKNPNLLLGEDILIPASDLNDGEDLDCRLKSLGKKEDQKGLSHKQIAEVVRNNFVRPKNPVWKLVKVERLSNPNL